MDHQSALGGAGQTDFRITHNGYIYIFGVATQAVWARFIGWLKQKTLRQAKQLVPEQYPEILQQVLAGGYGVGSPAFEAALTSFPGQIEMVRCLLRSVVPVDANPQAQPRDLASVSDTELFSLLTSAELKDEFKVLMDLATASVSDPKVLQDLLLHLE